MTPVQVIRVDPDKWISVRRMIIFLGFPLVQAMDLAIQFDEYRDRIISAIDAFVSVHISHSQVYFFLLACVGLI